jgi:SAM-dependent methyltransferase
MNTSHYDYQSKYFDNVANQVFNHINDSSSKKELERFLKFLNLSDCSNLRILEVGAGTGRYTIHLLDKGAYITATEISKESLNNIEQQAIKINKHDRLSLVHDSLETPIMRESFDLVFCVNLLHHVEDMDNVFKNMCEAAKKDAIIAIIEPNPLNLLFYIDFFRKKNWSVEKGILKCTKNNLFNLFKKNKLEDIKLERYIIIPNFILNKFPFLKIIDQIMLQVPIIKEFYMFHMIYAKKRG